jgi:glycosyltransferase involved in cell wall biosynthesis
MRIIYFSLDYAPHDHRFLSALAETEHDVFYVRLQRGARQTEDRPVPSNIEQVLWKGGQAVFHWRDLPRLTLDFRRLTREIKPDLIHAGPIQTCGLLAALTGFRPLLTMSWGFDLMQDAERNAWWRYVTRYTLARSTFFTSDCETTRQKAIAYGMNPNHTIVFPWGVDLERFTPAVTRHSSPDFTLFSNRSWEPLYGVDVLARAFVKAARQRPELRLMLLGGGSQGNLLRQILTDGGVMERVHFGGQVSQSELPRYYQMADLYISASHVDGSSVSLMEALACGLPALVSDIPANQEWVAEGVNGWLFPDGDIDALAAAILRAYDRRKNLAEIGRAARTTAEEKADWKKNFLKLLEAYDLALKVEGLPCLSWPTGQGAKSKG